jgi:hypothetical protein
MFHYEVYTEQQANQERFQLLKEGEYDAVIASSVDKTSANSGNPMMDMTISVFDADGKQHDVRDFLVFTKAMMWKVIRFSQAAGLTKDYEAGKLCSEVAIGNRVRVKVSIEQGSEIPADKLKGKPAGSRYPDKNKIDDYIVVSTGSPTTDVPPFPDDDIQF